MELSYWQINVIPCLIAGVVFILFVLKIKSLKNIIKKNDFIQYIDTSGIIENPPNFIEVWQGKTLNIKFNKYDIKIPFFGALESIKYIEKISKNYSVMINMINYKSLSNYDDIVKQVEYLKAYTNIFNAVYDISKKFIKNKKRYLKDLKYKFFNDIIFGLEISEQLFNYWKVVKKKIIYLASATTLRETDGESYTWNSLNLDLQGNISVKPRYESFWNISHN